MLDLSFIPDVNFSTLSFVGMNEASLEGNLLTLGPQTSAVLR